MRSVSAMLYLLFFSAVSFAQSFQPHSINYSVAEGLPSSECYEVMQDSKGLIWIATDKGICKYNGYTFTKYTTEDGLPDNTIFGFYEDYKHRLWGRTLSGGLFYFENDKIYIPGFNENLKKAAKTFVIGDFYVTDNDSVFLEMRESATFAAHLNSKEVKLLNCKVVSMRFFDKKAIISWDSASAHRMLHTLKLYIRYKEKTIMYGVKDWPAKLTGQKTALWSNGFMFNFGEDLYYYEESTNRFSDLKFRNRVLSIYEDHNKGIWVGTLNDGLYYYKYGPQHGAKHFFEDESVTSLFEDKEGGMWLTTLKSGVYYIPNKNNLSIEFSKEAFNVIKPIGNEMVGGSKNGNIYFFDSTGIKSMINLSASKTKGNIIYDLFDRDKSSFVAGGLTSFLINKKDHTAKLFQTSPVGNYTRGFSINPTKDTLFTFSYNIISLTTLSGFKTFYRPVDTRIVSIYCQTGKNVFIGAANGLYEYLDGNYSYLGAKNKLLQYRINDIAAFGDKLILATNGKGVLFVDLQKNIVKQVTESEGLSSNICQKIFIDGTTVWVATNKGISILEINNNGFGNTIRSIDKYDGLSGEEINNIWVDSTNTWVVSNSGISYFRKDLQMTNAVSPLIYLDFLRTNKGVYKNPEKKLIFNYDENYVAIDFYGLSFKSFKNLKYKYRLSGIDEAWHYTTDPKIIYPALSSGSYRFEVYAINNDNVQSAHSAILYFDVTPPFWRKWWFITAIILFLLSLITLFFIYRINTVKKEQLKTADLHKTFLNLKLKALRAQMNPHFTFNVMNSIQHFILTKDEEAAHRYLSKFSKLIRTILSNSEKNTIPVAEEIKALELYLELEAMRFEESFKYEIIVDETIDPDAVQIPSMLIQPYIENAIKHGVLPLKESGKIKVEIRMHDSFLKCVIEDNGIGRAKAAEQNKNKQHHSMGISLTAERLIVINELNNSNLSEKIIDLTDEDGNASGTRIEIYIPII